MLKVVIFVVLWMVHALTSWTASLRHAMHIKSWSPLWIDRPLLGGKLSYCFALKVFCAFFWSVNYCPLLGKDSLRDGPKTIPFYLKHIILLDYYLPTSLLADKGEIVISTKLVNEQTAVCYQMQPWVQPRKCISDEELNNRDVSRKLFLFAFLGLTIIIMSNYLQ